MKHTDHNHPNTTAARTACRKGIRGPWDGFAAAAAASTVAPLVSIGRTVIATTTEPHNYIKGTHCQACGSVDWEDVMTGSDPALQGYSRCCNERVVVGRLGECNADNCYHA